MNDLDGGKFSILNFYERRARRILPALFVVMAATVPFAYLWMMPDEFKNYGQSLVATSLFSNNILLAATSGYWSLGSIFKPFLHTWSLGGEEQYYMIFPLFLMGVWKYLRWRALHVMALLFMLSLAAATWGVAHFPATAFYILPTRGWELLAGAMAAYWLNYRAAPSSKGLLHEVASVSGLAMIAFAVAAFDDSYPSPGPWILFPVGGAVLVIAFAVEGTLAHRLLASRVMVGIGLISYSLYLWHQPLFALARIHAVDPPRPQDYAPLIAATFVLSYLTWRFVERPFRNRQLVGRQAVLLYSLCGSLAAITFGLYLNQTYGMSWRAFPKNETIADLDKRLYNTRVFKYRKDHFSNKSRRDILVIGNSFARDFINMTTETFDTRDIEFVYMDKASTCIDLNSDPAKKSLFEGADIIVFANIDKHCVLNAIQWAGGHKKKIFFVGTKNFGYNLNWIIQLPPAARANQYNRLPDFARDKEQADVNTVPAANFISLLGPVVKNGMVPITDDQGRMISTDREHVTKFGAIYFGERALRPSAYGALLVGNGAKLP